MASSEKNASAGGKTQVNKNKNKNAAKSKNGASATRFNHCNLPDQPPTNPQCKLKNSMRKLLFDLEVNRTGISVTDLWATVSSDNKLFHDLTKAVDNPDINGLSAFLSDYKEVFHVRGGVVYVQKAKKQMKRYEDNNLNRYVSNGMKIVIPDLAKKPINYIVLASQISHLCDNLLKKAERAKGPIVIAIDIELNILPRGEGRSIALLQLSTMDKMIYLIDIMQCPHNPWDKKFKLKTVLESDKIIKVVHDGREDLRRLYDKEVDVHVTNIFDTSVAYGLIGENCMDRNYNPNIGLAKLAEEFGWSEIPKRMLALKKLVKEEYKKRNSNVWGQRPLPTHLMSYAAFDVRALVPEMYTNLLNELETLDLMEEFTEKCDRRVTYAAAGSVGLDTADNGRTMGREGGCLNVATAVHAPEMFAEGTSSSNGREFDMNLPFSNRKKAKERQRKIDAHYSRAKEEEERKGSSSSSMSNSGVHPVTNPIPLPKEPDYPCHEATEDWDEEIGNDPHPHFYIKRTWDFRAPDSAFEPAIRK